MGIGFVILIHLIVIFILSVIISIIVSIITMLVADKEYRKRKIFFAIISPFVGLYSLYFFGLFGSIVVSEIKKIDIGIGDEWYVPLPDNCQLLSIDLPEQAYIEKNGQAVISEVSQIQQTDHQIFGKTFNGKYFSYNTNSNELKEFINMNDFTIENPNITPKLINAIDFYTNKRNDIAGFSINIVGVFSLLSSITILYLIRKLILRKTKTLSN